MIRFIRVTKRIIAISAIALMGITEIQSSPALAGSAYDVYGMNTDLGLSEQVEVGVYSFIDDISQSELFCNWADADVVLDEIYSHTKNNLDVYKIDVVKNNKRLGHVLVDELGNIISYSCNNEPEEFMQDYCRNYKVFEANYSLNSYNDEICSYSISQTYSSPYMVIDGVSPQLQGNANCIVAAASNVIWYYGKNGHASLIKNYSFNDVKNAMTNCYRYNGGYRNDTTPSAFKAYINAKGLANSYNSKVKLFWKSNATKALMISEINNKKPIMLGFAKGSIFSNTDGHMTMCYGYQITGGNTYAYVASGHQAYGTFVKWDDAINDCIITIRIY